MIGFRDFRRPLPWPATGGILPPVPAEVVIEPAALAAAEKLAPAMRLRVLAVVERLADWPDVSGEKALAGDHKGSFRIRTGDYRVVYRVENPRGDRPTVVIWKVGDRRDVYDD